MARTTVRCRPSAAALIFLALPALPALAAPDAGPLSVERRDLAVTLEHAGFLESASWAPVRVAPVDLGKEARFVRVLRAGEAVARDQVVAEIDAPALREEIELAKRECDRVAMRLDLLQSEAEHERMKNAKARESVRWRLARAEEALEVYVGGERADALKHADLRLAEAERRLRNEEEELAQLEEMYAGTELESGTKEIVLERARRSVALAKERLALERRARERTHGYGVPRHQAHLEREVLELRAELKRLGVEADVLERRQRAEQFAAELELLRQRMRVERAQRALEATRVCAPVAGVLAEVKVREGEPAGGGQAVGQVIDGRELEVRFAVPADELAFLQLGKPAEALVAAFGATLRGQVVALAPRTKEDGEALFEATCGGFEASGELPLVGMPVEVRVEGRVVEDVLSVSRRAFEDDLRDGTSEAVVWTGRALERRTVRLGAGGSDFVQVLEGLRGGEELVPLRDFVFEFMRLPEEPLALAQATLITLLDPASPYGIDLEAFPDQARESFVSSGMAAAFQKHAEIVKKGIRGPVRLERAPYVDARGHMVLAGRLDSEPQALGFHLAFEGVEENDGPAHRLVGVALRWLDR